jgi:hypothetical protein
MELTLGNIILLCVFTEAVTELIFKAAPLQPIRLYIRNNTTFLYSLSQDQHLLDCKYCVSVWVGFLTFLIYCLKEPHILLTILLYSCIIHRVSNYLHLGFSIVRDVQFDIRVNRGR